MGETKLPTTLAILRPHHALCALFFEGKGYGQTFIENMTSFLGEPSRMVQITTGCDVLCQACPNNHDGLCSDETKVSLFDERTLSHIGSLIVTENPIQLSSLCQVVYDSILQADLLAEVCGECEWAPLCQDKWQRGEVNLLLQSDPESSS